MKAGWEVKKLEDVCYFQNGFAFKSNLFLEKGRPIIRISNIQNQQVVESDLVYFNEDDYKENFDKFKVSKGDILIAMSGGTTGKIGVNTLDKVFYLNQRVGKFSPKKNFLNQYLYYYLLTKTEESLIISAGSAQPNLSTEQIKSFLVPSPSMQEQQRIVAILDQAFEGIAKARANSEQNLQNAQNIYMSVLDKLFFNLSGSVKPVELRDFVDVLTDYHANGSYETLKQHVELKETEDYAWMVRSTDFENDFENDKRYINKHAYDYLTKSCIVGGEIIMSKIGNAGKVYLMPAIKRPCSLAMNLFLIRLKTKLSSKFVYYFLKTSNGTSQIKSRLQGAATQTITKENVRNLLIPVCSQEKQAEIVSRIESLSIETQRLEALYQRKIALLDELKKSLLQQAFAGEL